MMPTSELPLIGASGAVAGVISAYLILHPRVMVDPHDQNGREAQRESKVRGPEGEHPADQLAGDPDRRLSMLMGSSAR